MPDYNLQTGQFSRWTRCHYVGISNPHLGIPAATFMEEEVLVMGGEEINRQISAALVEPFTPDNVAEAFDLVHPESGAVMGSMTYQELYVALASAYRHVAGKRDAVQAAPPTE